MSTQDRPLQFRLRTAMLLMLIVGAGGGLWLRRVQQLRVKAERRQRALVELSVLADKQANVTARLLDRLDTGGQEGGIAFGNSRLRRGPGKTTINGEGHWGCSLKFSQEDDCLCFVSISSRFELEKEHAISIKTYTIPEYEAQLADWVNEVKAEYTKQKWKFEHIVSDEAPSAE